MPKREIYDILKYSPFTGASIRQTFDQWRRNDLRRIVAAVQDGAVNGLSVAEIVKKIRGSKSNGYNDGIAQTSKNSATTLARTVINGVSNAARMETLQANADVLDGIQFLATLDGRTTFICASLDGKIWRGPEMASAPRPPLHPNCRSTVIPYIELRDPETGELIEEPTTRPAANADFDKLAEEEYNKNAKTKGSSRRWNDLSASTRKKYYYKAQRDWETANGGKNAYKQVPASTEFKEYFESQPKPFRESWLGAKRFDAYKTGQIGFDDLVKPDTGYVVSIADFKKQGVYFEHKDAIEINTKNGIEKNTPLIKENMRIEAEQWVYPALRALNRGLPANDSRLKKTIVDLREKRKINKLKGPANEIVEFWGVKPGSGYQIKYRCFYDNNGSIECIDDFFHPDDCTHIFPHRHVFFSKSHSLEIDP